MEVFLKGKQAVLDHLEKDALERSGGHEGAYLLAHDDSGDLVAVIAGRIFIAQTGTIDTADKEADVVNGIVTNLND